MVERFSLDVALEIPGKGYQPILKRLVDRFKLKPCHTFPGGRKVVARNPEWSLRYCENCNSHFLTASQQKPCPFCKALSLFDAIDYAHALENAQSISEQLEIDEEFFKQYLDANTCKED